MIPFARANAVRIVLGLVLGALVYLGISAYATYRREQRIALEVEALRGVVNFEYCGPKWIPTSIQQKLPICNRIATVDLDRLFFGFSDMPSENLITELGSLKKLRSLNLRGTKITDMGLEQLKESSSLETLNVDQTRISDSGLEHLKGLKNLKELGLGGTQVTDQGLTRLTGLTSLTNLNLTGLKVTDAGMVHLNGLTKLECLSLDGTEVTEQFKDQMETDTKRRTRFQWTPFPPSP